MLETTKTTNKIEENNTFKVGYSYYPHESLEFDTWIVNGTTLQATEFLTKKIEESKFSIEFKIFELIEFIKL